MLLAKQVKDIVFVIQSFLDKVANTAGNLDEMLDEDYSKGRKEQTKTRIVYSAFPPDGTEVSVNTQGYQTVLYVTLALYIVAFANLNYLIRIWLFNFIMNLLP